MKFDVRTIVRCSVAAGFLCLAAFPSTLKAQSSDVLVGNSGVEAQAQQAWREVMHHNAAPANGCFQAEYPSTEWQKVECRPAPGYRSALPSRRYEDVLGNGKDYVAEAPSGHTISTAAGTFPTVTGVTSEKTVNVPFGGGESSGITGKNEYTIQVNTNFAHTAACKTYTSCLAWVQYVISSNTPVSLSSGELTNDTEVFIEYWLIDYGSSSSASCPSGFLNAGADAEGPGVDCVQNGAATLIATGQVPITKLSTLALSGSAAAGGNDSAVATYGTKAYTATVSDSLTDISAGWTEAEFNIVGNAGGARAQFNTGSSITAKVALTDGSTTTPTCLAPSAVAGTTGETNNLTGKSCTATGGSSPSIQFVESN